jgi:hypothetical protein
MALEARQRQLRPLPADPAALAACITERLQTIAGRLELRTRLDRAAEQMLAGRDAAAIAAVLHR